MGGYDGPKAIVAAMPSIVVESRGGGKSEFMVPVSCRCCHCRLSSCRQEVVRPSWLFFLLRELRIIVRSRMEMDS